MRRGFTLLELIVVIIILGILATLGFTQYVKVVEKGRTAEARAILGDLRTANEAYSMESGSAAASITNLPIDAPTACTSTHYFSYSFASGTGTALRCTASGKTPQAATAYSLTLTADGTWGGTAGYY